MNIAGEMTFADIEKGLSKGEGFSGVLTMFEEGMPGIVDKRVIRSDGLNYTISEETHRLLLEKFEK